MTDVARDRDIVRLRRQGKPFRQIAAILDVTPGVVAGVCFRAGLCDPRNLCIGVNVWPRELDPRRDRPVAEGVRL